MQTFIGFDDNALKYNRSYEISDAVPAIHKYSNVVASPVWPTIEGNFLEELGGGIFTQSGQFIDSASQPRSDNSNGIRLGQKVDVPHAISSAIPAAVFGGVFFDHFGHFLLEGSARLWCLDQYRHLPWIFLSESGRRPKAYQRDFLAVLGLSPEQIVPVSEWHHIGELIVPGLSFTYHHHASQAYRETFQRAKLPPGPGGRKIFLSRTNTTIARTIGESELEAILAANGWEIVYPEALAAAAQAALFRDDNILLGLQGSAMHLGLFAPEGRRVIHLCRGLGYRGYYLLDDLVRANATYFSAMRRHRLESKPITGPFLLDVDSTLGFLREQGLVAKSAVRGSAIEAASAEALEAEYEAWWHHTESQIRFHHQVSHDGTPVAQITALDSALNAVALHPREPTILCHALALLLKFHGADAAGALLDRHAGDAPALETREGAQIFYYRSLISDARRDYEGAVAAALRATQLDPDNVAYTNQCAAVLYRLGQLEEAETLLLDSVRRETAQASTYFVLSLVAQAKPDDEGALEWARRAFQADRVDENCCRHLVSLLAQAGETAEALAACRRHLDRRPDNFEILMQGAAFAQHLGEPAEAAGYLLRAHAQAPDDDQLVRRSAALLTELGRIPDLMSIGRTPSPAAQEQSVMIYRRSLALAESGLAEQALKLAIVAAEIWPDNETILFHFLGLMIRAGHQHAARVLIRMIIAKGIETGQVYYVLSLLESDLGDQLRAREAARRAAELAPGNLDIAAHYERF